MFRPIVSSTFFFPLHCHRSLSLSLSLPLSLSLCVAAFPLLHTHALTAHVRLFPHPLSLHRTQLLFPFLCPRRLFPSFATSAPAPRARPEPRTAPGKAREAKARCRPSSVSSWATAPSERRASSSPTPPTSSPANTSPRYAPFDACPLSWSLLSPSFLCLLACGCRCLGGCEKRNPLRGRNRSGSGQPCPFPRVFFSFFVFVCLSLVWLGFHAAPHPSVRSSCSRRRSFVSFVTRGEGRRAHRPPS